MKENLRAQKLLERLEHHPEEKKQKDEKIIKRITQLPEFEKAKVVLFYISFRGEVDLEQLFVRYHSTKKFVLPRVNGENLDLYAIQNWSDTEVGSFQIPEPLPDLPNVMLSEIDLVLIPGIAFSHNGHRIGYGRGFYDRLLKKLACPKIGIAYDFQIVKNIPGELHDVPMDTVVTESLELRINN